MSQQLANRLMLQSSTTNSALPTAIFGTAGQMSQTLALGKPRSRIGFWPILSTDQPEVAMGLAAFLSFHLERYQSVRVYRLFVRFDNDSESHEWRMSDSQFEVDDWQLDDLDENVAIWGRLTTNDSGYHLEIDIENDMVGDEEVETQAYDAAGLVELVTLIPVVAEKVMQSIGETQLKRLDFAYDTEDLNNTQVSDLLVPLFEWERDLLIALRGGRADESRLLESARDLCIKAHQTGQPGDWAASLAIERWLIFASMTDTEDSILDLVNIAADSLDPSPFPGLVLSQRLFRSGEVQQAIELIDTSIEQIGLRTDLALVKTDLMRRLLDISGAIDVAQEAIEAGEFDTRLLFQYAELMQLADYNSFEMEEYSLNGTSPLEEAIAAYDRILEMNPGDTDALSQKLLHSIDLDLVDADFWDDFTVLVQHDADGNIVKNVLDNLYPEDAEPAIAVLRQSSQDKPEKPSLLMNLAVAYLLADEPDSAEAALEQARELLPEDAAMLAEIDRLLLAVDDPDFEMHIGELTSLVDAGKSLPTEEVEFLENAIEQAPTFSEGYVLLARSYLAWDETSAAIETLLDGHKHLPEDPEIIRILVRALWRSDEKDLALSYLNKGIAANPDYVPLLAQAGQYLFVSGEEDVARAFLMRAELIAPRDPALAAARAYIARNLGN